MSLGYVLAHGKLFDLGLDILSIMKDNNTIVPTIMFDDSTMLKIWFFYIKEQDSTISWEEALQFLDETPGGLEPFKKAFWDLVVSFFPITLQPTLRKGWKEVEKQIKDVAEKNSTTSISPSPQD